MKGKLSQYLVSVLVSIVVYGGLMFIFYHFVNKLSTNEALGKAALAGLVFGVLSLLIKWMLGRNKKS